MHLVGNTKEGLKEEIKETLEDSHWDLVVVLQDEADFYLIIKQVKLW